MNPVEAERRGKRRGEIIAVGDVGLAVVKVGRRRAVASVDDIIAVAEDDGVERALKGHVIIAISENDRGQAVAAENRDIGRGAGIADDDVADPVQIKQRVRAADIVDNAEGRFGIEGDDELKFTHG